MRPADAPADHFASYTRDGLLDVITFIKAQQSDIITLQEVHGSDRLLQANEIARALGMTSVVFDVYADSHLEEGQALGQAIISRYPIVQREFVLFENPKLTMDAPNGGVWVMHDKGVTRCSLSVEGRMLDVATVHMPPFRKFGMDPLAQEWSNFRADYARKLSTQAPVALLQGDFNFDQSTIEPFLPEFFKDGFQEYPQSDATTPKGRTYDHVVWRGLSLQSQVVHSDVFTDHYPVVSEFTL